MGGKSNLLDPVLLSGLYKESLQFYEDAELKLKLIQAELNRLNDVSVGQALRQEKSEVDREQINGLSELAASVKDAIDQLQRFITPRLSDAVIMERERSAEQAERHHIMNGVPMMLLKK